MNASPRVSTYAIVERVLNVAFSVAALIITAPFQACIALAVRVVLGRPAFFPQERPGLGGRMFQLLEFRTMLEPDTSLQLIDNESRMTALGELLRSTRLNKLPSLWNLLREDTRVFGPRPLLPAHLPLYTARQATRHDLHPRITGLTQISGRTNITWSERREHDARQVEDCHLTLDARILVATVLVIILRDDVSAEGTATMPPVTSNEVSLSAKKGEPRWVAPPSSEPTASVGKHLTSSRPRELTCRSVWSDKLLEETPQTGFSTIKASQAYNTNGLW